MKPDITLVKDTKEDLQEAFNARNLGWMPVCTDHTTDPALVTVRPNPTSLFARVYCSWCGEFQRKINL